MVLQCLHALSVLLVKKQPSCTAATTKGFALQRQLFLHVLVETWSTSLCVCLQLPSLWQGPITPYATDIAVPDVPSIPCQ